jgi:hypothetical protein
MKINPIKGTFWKDDNIQELGMQGLNDTCFGICTAFSGSNNAWEIDPHCAKACEALIEDKRYSMYGVGHCDHQAPYRPQIWNQNGRYLPKLLKKHSPQSALQHCKQMCNDIMNGNQECINNCEVDYHSIVQEEFQHKPKNPLKTPPPPPPKKKLSAGEIAGIIIGILIAIALIVFVIIKLN